MILREEKNELGGKEILLAAQLTEEIIEA